MSERNSLLVWVEFTIRGAFIVCVAIPCLHFLLWLRGVVGEERFDAAVGRAYGVVWGP